MLKKMLAMISLIYKIKIIDIKGGKNYVRNYKEPYEGRNRKERGC